MFQDLSKLKEAGFTGFLPIANLWNDHSVIPKEPGVYLILNTDLSKKSFLSTGVGGFFKGQDPNVSIDKLSAKWVDTSHVIYIGKAGGDNSSATLRQRLKQYLDFGKGKPVGHRGGRYIWQLSHHPELLIAWKILKNTDPRTEEKKLIADFDFNYGKLPFANLVN